MRRKDLSMYIYIAYRDLEEHLSLNNGFGGIPVNNDYRFIRAGEGDSYVLIKYGAEYAVSKEAGDRFIEEVLGKCGDPHPGFFSEDVMPGVSKKAAIVEAEREVENNGRKWKRTFYYDMDAEVLFQMLEDLRERSGEPSYAREQKKYFYPNAVLPAGDLTTIDHGICFKLEAPDIQAPASHEVRRCLYCGADVTGMKFCSECGGKVASE